MITKRIERILPIAALLIGGTVAKPLLALTCGGTVSGNVVLTADLVCNNSHGLIVGSSNTTINLNGHSIVCNDPQCGPDNNSVSREGILSMYRDNVKVLGPGQIVGFAESIFVEGGKGLVVSQVTMSGAGRDGIHLFNIGTADCGQAIVNPFNPPAPNFTLSGNSVAGKVFAVRLDDSHCGQVSSNTFADNNQASQLTNTVLTVDGNYNDISQNTLAHNIKGDGIDVLGNKNRVTGNYLTLHGTYGISATGTNNIFTANTSRFATIADMIDHSVANSWNVNNLCNTQSKLPMESAIRVNNRVGYTRAACRTPGRSPAAGQKA